MKLTTILLLLPFLTTAQGKISGQMRIGYSNTPIISPSIDFSAYNIHLSSEMLVNVANDKPTDFGLKISYEYKFIQAGYGRYYSLFTQDAYDKHLNGWRNMFFVSVHWKDWFVEYDYIQGSVFSIGYRETLAFLQ